MEETTGKVIKEEESSIDPLALEEDPDMVQRSQSLSSSYERVEAFNSCSNKEESPLRGEKKESKRKKSKKSSATSTSEHRRQKTDKNGDTEKKTKKTRSSRKQRQEKSPVMDAVGSNKLKREKSDPTQQRPTKKEKRQRSVTHDGKQAKSPTRTNPKTDDVLSIATNEVTTDLANQKSPRRKKIADGKSLLGMLAPKRRNTVSDAAPAILGSGTEKGRKRAQSRVRSDVSETEGISWLLGAKEMEEERETLSGSAKTTCKLFVDANVINAKYDPDFGLQFTTKVSCFNLDSKESSAHDVNRAWQDLVMLRHKLMNEDVSDNKILRDLGELFPWSWAARVDAPSSDSRIRSVFRKKARPLLASEASVCCKQINIWLQAALSSVGIDKSQYLRHFLAIRVTRDFELLLMGTAHSELLLVSGLSKEEQTQSPPKIEFLSGQAALEQVEKGTEMELREYIATQEEELSRILAKIDKTTDIKGKERLRIELEAAEVLLEALQTNLQALVDHSPQPQLNFSGKTIESEGLETMERELRRRVMEQEHVVADCFEKLQSLRQSLAESKARNEDISPLSVAVAASISNLEEAEMLLEALQGNLQALVDDRQQPQFLNCDDMYAAMTSPRSAITDNSSQSSVDAQERDVESLREKISDMEEMVANLEDDKDKKELEAQLKTERERLTAAEESLESVKQAASEPKRRRSIDESTTLSQSRKLRQSSLSMSTGSFSVIRARTVLNAISDGDVEKVRKECQRAFFDSKRTNSEGFHALTLAAKLNHYQIIEILLKCGAKVDRPDDKGRTALYVAAQYNAQQAATTLLEQGADIDRQCTVGNCTQTPTEVAAKQGYTSMLLALGRESGVKLTEAILREDWNQACEYASRPFVDPHFKDTSGCTPLHHAMKEGIQELVKVLARAGASLHMENKAGQLPTDVAAEYGHSELVEVFEEEAERAGTGEYAAAAPEESTMQQQNVVKEKEDDREILQNKERNQVEAMVPVHRNRVLSASFMESVAEKVEEKMEEVRASGKEQREEEEQAIVGDSPAWRLTKIMRFSQLLRGRKENLHPTPSKAGEELKSAKKAPVASA